MMALQDDKIKDLFSSKLSNFEPEVPASIWAGIDQALSQLPPAQAPDASASQVGGGTAAKSGLALKATLATVGIAASVAVGVVLYNQSDDVALETVPEVAEIIVEEETTDDTLLAQHDESNTDTFNAIPLFTQSRRMAATPQPEAEEHAEAAKVLGEVDIEEKQAEVIEEVAETEETADIEDVEEIEALSVPKFLKEDVAISIRSNVGALSSTMNEKGGGLLFSKNDRSSAFSEYLKDEDKDYKLSHNQPVSVGVTASKYVTERLSIEAGLMFTYLSSKITSNSSINIEEKQTFGYLGVPIYINYEFYRLKKAKFYLSLGAMMQKDIFGRYTSTFALGEGLVGVNAQGVDAIYSESRHLKKNISQSNWQFSTHMNIGVAYPIYRRMYFYSQLGGAYYFDANNEYRTIFSDRKFQLDLNLGIRFDF